MTFDHSEIHMPREVFNLLQKLMIQCVVTSQMVFFFFKDFYTCVTCFDTNRPVSMNAAQRGLLEQWR